MIRHATIVPLIGGMPIASTNVFGARPEYIMTYDGFQPNETHLLNYYKNTPYYNLSESKGGGSVDVISATCPCAGLSSLSPSASSDSKMNNWMFESTQYVLNNIKPKVLWGENAPRLASKMGAPVVSRLRDMAKENGYSFSIYKTKSILHGLSQVRDRTFYFFWQGNQIPVLDYIHRPYQTIEDHIRSVERRDDDPMSQILCNDKLPTDNPFYQYVLEEIEGGITHQEFFNRIERTTNPLDHIEKHTDYSEVGKWMTANGYDREAAKCERMYHKLASGVNIMRKTTEIPKDYIGAFVGHMPTSLTHPDENRYLTVREALSIMKLPKDFTLLNPKRSLNHICQNVPVSTAMDMAGQIKKYFNNELETVQTNYMVQDNKKKTCDYESNTLEDFI